MAENIGKAAYDLLIKPDEKISVIDMQREMHKKIMKNMEETIERNRHYTGLYYLVCMLQRERMMPNVIRHWIISRYTRPRPDYDCSLYSYDNRIDELKFHWSIPDEDRCAEMLQDSSTVPFSEKELFSYVQQFSKGTLV